MKNEQKYFFGPVVFWTVLTTVFAWLPLVRIIGRPAGYHWSILGFGGAGRESPYWLFILLTLYVVTLLFSMFRGPRALFYPMLILWHLVVTVVVILSLLRSGWSATWQGQGLHFELPMWLIVIPCAGGLVCAVVSAVVGWRGESRPLTVPWTRANSGRLAVSLALLVVALGLFHAGTNYNWVTAAAIITTILHWILLVEAFQSAPATTRKA